MSFVGLILQGLISVLLVAGFAYGLRLHRKLDELRNSQAGFAAAVAELDRAAARAEAGLASLRESTDTAREELADRIDSARTLVGRLEQAASDAAVTLKRLEAAQRDGARGAATALKRAATFEDLDAAAAPRSREPSPALAAAYPRRAEPSPMDRPEPIIHARRAPAHEAELFEPAPAESGADRLRRISELLRAPEDGDRRAGARAKVRT